MLKHALVAVACCLLLAATSQAELKQIKLKNGRVFVGDVVEKTKDGIKVKGKLAVLFYPSDEIESIEAVRDPKAEYAQRLAKVDKASAGAHVRLGRWAMDNKLYKQAAECFRAALKIKKDHERAKLLLRQAEAKLAENTGNGGEDVGETTAIEKVPFDRKLLVKMPDIYRIRLEEVRQDDRVSVRLNNKVVDRFIKQMRGIGDFEKKGSDTQFRRLPPAAQAKYILAKADRDDPLKDDIIVQTDPAFMKEFRTTVWPTVAGSCASINCHGSGKGKGKLKLFNFSGRSINVEYTNFLILDSYQKRGLPMIRRDEWEKSLLLQYALPPAQAEYRHPHKRKPVFSGRQASGYRQTLAWIKKLKGPQHPSYRIKDRPPNVMAAPAGLPGLPVRKPKGKPRKKPDKKPEVPF